MKKIIAIWFISFCLPMFSYAVMPNHCEKFSSNPPIMKILESLATKLSYSFNEMCTQSRIADIYQETKQVYIREKDAYHDHIFVTLHYYEYSCEYQFDLVEQRWGKQNCYNTW